MALFALLLLPVLALLYQGQVATVAA